MAAMARLHNHLAWGKSTCLLFLLFIKAMKLMNDASGERYIANSKSKAFLVCVGLKNSETPVRNNGYYDCGFQLALLTSPLFQALCKFSWKQGVWRVNWLYYLTTWNNHVLWRIWKRVRSKKQYSLCKKYQRILIEKCCIFLYVNILSCCLSVLCLLVTWWHPFFEPIHLFCI